ncbi:MAG: molybdopterin-dependent oxidoreductase [Planctomycetes bacterium]|nr:molybdopterin-dependent oxidoreductase [Planctomycetota bacterium]
MCEAKMSLTISGEVENQKSFAYADLKAMPNQVEDVAKEVEGRQGHGVRLRGLIDKAGRKDGATHATLASTDGKFTASVPLDDILDALLVYELDGKPLPEQYGGPIRFLIPDAAACHTGGADTCANVKFLGRIELTRGKVEDSRDKMDETPHG